MITEIQLNGRVIYLLGTAHVSKESVEDVREVIETKKPDTVCVELDARREKSLINKKRWQETNIVSIMRKKQGMFMIASLMLSAYQKRIGSDVTPGAEMLEALKLAKKENIHVSLCDRPIEKTLKRAWRKTGFLKKLRLLEALFSASFSTKSMKSEDIESLKNQDAIDSMMKEISDQLPSIKTVLIDERDQYLAKKIHESPGKGIVAVLGMGHLKGVEKHLRALEAEEYDISCDQLSEVPKPSKIGVFLKWAIPIGIIALITRGAFTSDWASVFNNFLSWFMVNGTLSAFAAILALAHPITIVGTFLAAPFTSLSPAIGVGFVAGIIEGSFRKPLVRDFQNVTNDIRTLRGVYRNRVSRVLLVFFLTTIGSAIGTFSAISTLF